MTLEEVRDFIAGLGIAEREHCYIGRMPDKERSSIGIYRLNRDGKPHIPIGGRQNASHDVLPVSFLIHWNESFSETEEAADRLYNALDDVRNQPAGSSRILFCTMLVPEPQHIGTQGYIYEAVIEVKFYVKRGEKADD